MTKEEFVQMAREAVVNLGFTDWRVEDLAEKLMEEGFKAGLWEHPGFYLSWPTNYPIYTQSFRNNPGYYGQFIVGGIPLPGHEGVDIRAPIGTPIKACAQGTVYLVSGPQGAYGNQVRIRHQQGYKTIYAHLERATVVVGQVVERGEVIGLADNTGNSFGSHLHLTLKKEGATERGETDFPNDIIDPTPLLMMPS